MRYVAGWLEHWFSRFVFVSLVVDFLYFFWFGYDWHFLFVSIVLWLCYWVCHKVERWLYHRG